jgi:hypothetical protein
MTASRLAALTQSWRETPPAAVALAGVSALLRSLAGVPQPRQASAARRPAAEPTHQEASFLGGLPTVGPVRYMTAEEYLRTREAPRDEQ